MRSRRPRRESLILGSRRGVRFYVETQRVHGDVVELSIPLHRVVLVSDPRIAREVLRRDVDDFRKGFGNEVLEPLIGQGLFLAEGDDWRHLRRVEAPRFHQDAIGAWDDVVDRHAAEMVDTWAAADEVDLYPEVVRRTLAMVSHALLGTDRWDGDEAARLALDELWCLTQRRLNPLRRWLELRNRIRFSRHLGAIRSALRETMSAPAEGSALADLAASDLDDRAVLDDAMTFLVAGQECTPLAIAWSLYFVARDEAQAAQPADRIVREAMRLRPPAWMMARQANRDTEVGGIAFARDTVVLISPLVIHRHPALWEQPDVFDASRFAEDRFVTAQKRAYMPFGSGPRTCLGMHFALRIAERMVAAVLERYRLEADPTEPPAEGTSGLTLRPERPLLVRVRKR